MSQEEPEIKKFKHSIISDHINSNEFRNIFSTYWYSFREVKNSNLEIIAKPFRICRISNFLKDEYFMDELKNQLSNVKSRRNIMDLYQYEQSNDLTNVNKSNIKILCETLQTDITSWMQHNTGIRLNGKISMSSSCYSDTDYLLCHDDNMEDRRIAYILYLSKNWLLEDGGTLDLFDTDQDGLPRNVVKSLLPEYNSLVFFEVVDTSYHQVAEVKSSVKCRWSINGWFHGPLTDDNRKQRAQSLPPPLMAPKSTEINLESWVTPDYLRSNVMKDIKSQISNNSYTFLTNFLRIKMYERIMIDLTSQDIHWQMVGPADVRHYEIADEKTLPETLKDFYDIFKSITTFRLLKNYTELDLVPDKKNMDPKMTIELQRWSTGCYTLMYDRSMNNVNDNWNTNESHSDSLSNPDPHEEKSTVVSEKMTMISMSQDSQASSVDNNEKKIVSSQSEANSSMKTDHDIEENNTSKYIARDKFVKTSDSRPPREILLDNSEDSTSEVDMNSNANESSDIGDYLSDRLSSENDEDTASEKLEGTLDVILQFHTSILPADETIDYVDPSEPDGTLIQIPIKDNHLCLVYKTLNVHRVHKYINHYCQGYFYNLICTYYE